MSIAQCTTNIRTKIGENPWNIPKIISKCLCMSGKKRFSIPHFYWNFTLNEKKWKKERRDSLNVNANHQNVKVCTLASAVQVFGYIWALEMEIELRYDLWCEFQWTWKRNHATMIEFQDVMLSVSFEMGKYWWEIVLLSFDSLTALHWCFFAIVFW